MQLQSAMERYSSQLVTQGNYFGAPEKMQKVAEKLSKRFQGASLAATPQSRICHAVQSLKTKKVDVLTRLELKALCQGLRHSCPDCDSQMVVELPQQSFVAIMDHFIQNFDNHNLKANSWYWLLYAYFNTPEKNAAWEALRKTLETSLNSIKRSTQYRLPWLDVVSGHDAILSSEPCTKLAKKMLAGDTSVIEQFNKILKIPENSWFWKELVLAQVKLAIGATDDKFVDMLPTLITSSQSLSLTLKDEIIKLLLTRYASCSARGTHNGLKEFTLTHWGTPNLGRHQKYDLVSAHVKQMVQEWVAREDLKDFFTLLQDDGVADDRRLKFWSRYIKQIEFHRILLGSHAWRTSQIDFAALRKKPSVGKLIGTGSNNNAFVMKIAGWIFIESSEKGHAIFGYKQDNLPFRMEDREVSINSFRDRDKCDFRADHRDRRIGTWEEVVEQELVALGVEPDEKTVKQHRDSYFSSSKPRPAPSPNPTTRKDSFDEAAFWKLVREHKLSAGDNRAKGGALWVQGVPSKLKTTFAQMGFQHKIGRGWWRNG